MTMKWVVWAAKKNQVSRSSLLVLCLDLRAGRGVARWQREAALGRRPKGQHPVERPRQVWEWQRENHRLHRQVKRRLSCILVPNIHVSHFLLVVMTWSWYKSLMRLWRSSRAQMRVFCSAPRTFAGLIRILKWIFGFLTLFQPVFCFLNGLLRSFQGLVSHSGRQREALPQLRRNHWLRRRLLRHPKDECRQRQRRRSALLH